MFLGTYLVFPRNIHVSSLLFGMHLKIKFSSWLYARKIYDMQTLHVQGHPHVPGNISSHCVNLSKIVAFHFTRFMNAYIYMLCVVTMPSPYYTIDRYGKNEVKRSCVIVPDLRVDYPRKRTFCLNLF